MEIKIVNLKRIKSGLGFVKCDRSSPLGNPFVMRSEVDRNEVCNKYDEWFNEKISSKDEKVLVELRRIWKIGRELGIVQLACWCSPSRCHCETIKKFLNQYN